MTPYEQVDLPGYRHDIHIPVFREKEFLYTVFGIPMCPECVAIPFMMNKRQVGLLLAVYSDNITESYLDNSRWLGGKIKIRRRDYEVRDAEQKYFAQLASSSSVRRRFRGPRNYLPWSILSIRCTPFSQRLTWCPHAAVYLISKKKQSAWKYLVGRNSSH